MPPAWRRWLRTISNLAPEHEQPKPRPGNSVNRISWLTCSVDSTPALLKQWKTKVTSSLSVKRKCFVVETAALDASPEYPLDLGKCIIPRD